MLFKTTLGIILITVGSLCTPARGALFTIEALLVTLRGQLITSARASDPNRTAGTAEMEPSMFSTEK